MYRAFLIQIILILSQCSAIAQQTGTNAKTSWSFSTTGFYYFIPDDKNLLTLIGYADHKKLHFEARYNYEDEHTISAFAGWRFETNGKIYFSATPLLGIALGNTDGIVPGIELEMSYKKFDYYSETEYIIDFAGKENNFLYTWGELAISPVKALRTGITYQRTKLYQTDWDVQKGLFAEYSFWKLTAGTYYFNPFSGNDFLIISLAMDF